MMDVLVDVHDATKILVLLLLLLLVLVLAVSQHFFSFFRKSKVDGWYVCGN